MATLTHLRHDLPHSVLGLLFGVDRSTVTRAIGEVRTLLAERGCAISDRPGLRLRTMTDVFVYARAEGVELRLDATEIQVRWPPASRGGRHALLDDGYLGLSRDHHGQAITPPRKPRPGALPGPLEATDRWTHRRDVLPDTYRAIAGLVSDRTANA